MYRSERMRWIEATTPSQQITDDERIYEAWGKHPKYKINVYLFNLLIYQMFK